MCYFKSGTTVSAYTIVFTSASMQLFNIFDCKKPDLFIIEINILRMTI